MKYHKTLFGKMWLVLLPAMAALPTLQAQNSRPDATVRSDAKSAKTSPLTRNPLAEYADRDLGKEPSGHGGIRTLPSPGMAGTQPRKNTGTAVIYGNMIANGNWTTDKPYGVYAIQPVEGSGITPVAVDPALYPKGGGYYIDDKYHFTSYSTAGGLIKGYRSVYNLTTKTFEVNREECATDLVISGSAAVYDPTTRKVYGQFYSKDFTKVELGELDPSNNTRTTITTLSTTQFRNISVDSKGHLFGISNSGDLYSINKNTGEMLLIGATGLHPEFRQGAAIDPATDKLYWTFLGGDKKAGLYEVNTTTGQAAKIYDFPDGTEFINVTVLAPAAADLAPQAVSDLSVANPQGNDLQVDFTLPAKTYNGAGSLEGELGYVISVNDIEVVNEKGMPGMAVSRVLANQPAGECDVTVVVKNAVGNSPTVHKVIWNGSDSPQAPGEVTLQISDGHAQVNWTAPEAGVHGGALNADKLAYRLVRYPEGAVVAEGLKTLSFTDAVDTQSLRFVSYGVTAVHDNIDGAETVSNRVKVGSYITVPYLQNFQTEDEFGLHTVNDVNADGRTWVWQKGQAVYQYSTDNAADDWLFTPPVKMEKSTKYRISFKAKSLDYHYPEAIEVKYGPANSPDKMTTTILPATKLMTGEWEPFEYEFTNDTQEEPVYIGFHAVSDKYMYNLHVTGIRIDGHSMMAPGLVSDLTVTPKDKGSLTADITFTTPAKDAKGNALTGLNRVALYRNGTLLKEWMPSTVGTALAFTDNVNKRGSYEYEIVCANSYGEGETTLWKAFLGIDQPSFPKRLKMIDNLDGTTTLTWRKAEVGENGGYVDPDKVTYTVYSVFMGLGNLQLGPAITSVLADTTATVQADFSGEPGYYFMAVGAQNEFGSASKVGITDVISGTPVGLPFFESFPKAKISSSFWWTSLFRGASQWNLSSLSSDGDEGSMMFVSTAVGDEALLGTQKITLKGETNPKMLFRYYAVPGQKCHLRIEADKNQRDGIVVLKDIDVEKLTGEEGWRTAVIDLSSLLNETYVMLQIRAIASEPGATLGIDRVKVFTARERDLITSLTAKSIAKVNEDLNIRVNIANEGSTDATDYSVKLTARYTDVNGIGHEDVIGEQKGSTLPAYIGMTQATFSLKTTVAMPEKIEVVAEVLYPNDAQPADNIANATISIRQNEVPAPRYLTAKMNDGKTATLQWTAPSLNGQEPLIVKEGFENTDIFPPFDIGGITQDNRNGGWGEWTLFDGDGENTYSWTQADYPNAQGIMAWQVITPELIFDIQNPTVQNEVGSHQGRQYLMCFDASNAQGTASNDDWLISPELEGKAQTVSFYSKDITDKYGNEKYEVLYSIGGNAPEDFVKIADYTGSPSWKEVKVDLPEGAKHFAIRCISNNAFGLMVDDFTFEVPGKVIDKSIIGYNVYLNGELYMSTGGSTTTATTEDLQDGNLIFNVSAVYDDNTESPLSNAAALVVNGIQVVPADALNGQPAEVYGIDGTLVAQGNDVIRSLHRGTYIVRLIETNRVVKVVIP